MKKYSILLISLMLLSGCQKETFISNLDTINNILYNFKEELYKIKEYDDAEWKLTPNGSLKLGNITLQRKGGSGQPDNIQFKIKIPGIKD